MWQCGFCRSLNDDNERSCASCGASKADSITNYFEANQTKQTQRITQNKEIKNKNVIKKLNDLMTGDYNRYLPKLYGFALKYGMKVTKQPEDSDYLCRTFRIKKNGDTNYMDIYIKNECLYYQIRVVF